MQQLDLLVKQYIKFYKRKLFEKLDVKNITEASAFATNHKLIQGYSLSYLFCKTGVIYNLVKTKKDYKSP